MPIFSINFFTYDEVDDMYTCDASDLNQIGTAADLFPMQIASADRDIETFQLFDVVSRAEWGGTGEVEIMFWILRNDARDRRLMIYND